MEVYDKTKYLKLPIQEKLTNKIIFYLNIYEPMRGTSKLRGLQVYEKLLEHKQFDTIWIPSLHGHQFNEKLNMNIFDKVHDSIIFFIKYPVIPNAKELGMNILKILKKNNNKLIYDFCDTNIETTHFMESITYYDKIIFMSQLTKDIYSKKHKINEDKLVVIPHHYDSDIDNYKNELKYDIINPVIYYFGGTSNLILSQELKKLNVIMKNIYFIESKNDSIAHICFKKSNWPISTVKLGNCCALGSVPIINDMSRENCYFDEKYPYILKKEDKESLQILISKVKFDYLNNTSDFKLAIKYRDIIKKKISIDSVIKLYIDLISNLKT